MSGGLSFPASWCCETPIHYRLHLGLRLVKAWGTQLRKHHSHPAKQSVISKAEGCGVCTSSKIAVFHVPRQGARCDADRASHREKIWRQWRDCATMERRHTHTLTLPGETVLATYKPRETGQTDRAGSTRLTFISDWKFSFLNGSVFILLL